MSRLSSRVGGARPPQAPRPRPAAEIREFFAALQRLGSRAPKPRPPAGGAARKREG